MPSVVHILFQDAYSDDTPVILHQNWHQIPKSRHQARLYFTGILTKKTQNFSVGAPSTCLADTILPGINYLKGQPPVVALADEEYPKWLWTILQPKVLEDDGPGGKFERAKRRAANKQAIKDRNFMLTQ